MQRSIYPRNADEPRGGIGKLAREEPSFTRKKAPFFIKQKRLSLHPRKPHARPGAPSARRNGKIEAAFFGGEREAPFFRKAKTPLSLHPRKPRARPGAPSARRDRKIEAAFFGGEREGPLSFS